MKLATFDTSVNLDFNFPPFYDDTLKRQTGKTLTMDKMKKDVLT